MIRISATYTVQRTLEIDGFDSVDDEGANDKVDEVSTAVVKELEGQGWKVNVESLESEDEFEDDEDEEDEDEDDDENYDDEDDEDDDEDEEDDDVDEEDEAPDSE
jgi:hypothetical protein